MKFTLKVRRAPCNTLYPDHHHIHGGYNALQVQAFKHLIPAGFIEEWVEDALYDLAALHGWEVRITHTQQKTEQP